MEKIYKIELTHEELSAVVDALMIASHDPDTTEEGKEIFHRLLSEKF